MKRNVFLSLILTMAVFISCCTMNVFASDNEGKVINTTVEYYDDGSYDVITITEYENYSRASTKSGGKSYTHYNSSNKAVWSYTLNATFYYSGTSSSCTAVSDSYSIYDTSWTMYGHACSKSGNKAYGTCTMRDSSNTNTTKSLTITCSATGVLA